MREGGAQILNGDGTVHFLSDTVETSVIEALTTISGGEVLKEF